MNRTTNAGKITEHFSKAFAILAVLVAASAFNAFAETHALLVGVGRYPTLPTHRQLSGPPNDVQELRAALTARGLKRITTLSDSEPKQPTRANILAGLDGLIAQSAPGDWLFAFFAGHGGQQPVPVRTPTEPDDLDELFLPADVGRWNAARKTVDNAITDNEFGAWIARARASGRHVWVVFDTCHAGDMSKAFRPSVGADVRMREVSPAELGIPAVPDTPGRRTVKSKFISSSQSKAFISTQFVAMYAAQENEPTPEERRSFNGRSQSMGLFTASLLDSLRDRPTASARDLIVEVKRRYQVEKRVFPTPWAEGNVDAVLPLTSGKGATPTR